MKKGGKGGGKTITGLRFESRVDLKTVFKTLPQYTIKEDVLFYQQRKVAEFYGKHKLYKNLLEPNGIDSTEIISKKLLPDEAILILKNKILYIIEMKFQEVAGSVDEKLQTCDFKKKQYQKLLTPLKIKVEYAYVLSDWFKHPQYKDVLDYVHGVGCHYFFEELPLSFLNLPEPKT